MAQKQGDEYCRRIRLERLRFDLRLGTTDEGAADLRFVDELSLDPESLFLQADALTLLARIDALRAPSARRNDAQRRLQVLCCSDTGVVLAPPSQLLAVLALAEAALRSESVGEARRWLVQADRIEAQMGASVPPKLRSAALLLRGIADLHDGRFEAADAAIDVAHGKMAAEVGSRHPLARLFEIDKAIARAALGRNEEALSLVQQALPDLQAAMGSNSATFHRVARVGDQLRLRVEGAQSRAAGSVTLPTRDFFN